MFYKVLFTLALIGVSLGFLGLIFSGDDWWARVVNVITIFANTALAVHWWRQVQSKRS